MAPADAPYTASKASLQQLNTVRDGRKTGFYVTTLLNKVPVRSRQLAFRLQVQA